MRLLFILVIVVINKLLIAQTLEISIAPRLHNSIVESFSTGIVNDQKVYPVRWLPGYGISLSYRPILTKLNFGFKVSQELYQRGVYLEYRFPRDVENETVSKLYIINQAFSITPGIFIEYKLGTFSVSSTFNYVINFYDFTKGKFKYGFSNTSEKWDTSNYSIENGFGLMLNIMKHFNKKNSIGIEFGINTNKSNYINDTFLQEWEIISYYIGINYNYLIK